MDLDLTDRENVSKKIEIGKEIIYLTREECMNLGISVDDIIDFTKEALLAHGRKEYEMPAKIGIHPLEEAFFHAMPAYVPSKNAAGIKWVECFPKNHERFNLPQTSGLMILNDEYSGWPLAIMDAVWITAMRTPAVTSIAAKTLHPDAETFGMFGCGVQGMGHVEFITHTLKNLKKIYVHDVRKEAMDNLIATVQPKIDVEIVKAKDPEELVKSCEAVSSATVILKTPLKVVKKEWVSKGQTILPCDLNTFWDPEIPKMADKYIVDSIDEHELFDSMGYFPDGLPEIYCETGEVIAGLKKGRESKDQLIVNSNIGIAVADVVMAREIFNRALDKGVGTKLPL
jgi:ornithine cyclodeaminase/alanine dehydrogenase-like protein (mu-crystallin family)